MTEKQRPHTILGDWFGAVTEPLDRALQFYVRETTKRKLLSYCMQRNKRPDTVVDLALMRFLLEEEFSHD